MVTATTRPALDDAARQFIADHEARLRPLEHQVGLAWWNANVSGKDEDFARKEELQNQLDAALADTGRFGELKKLRFGKIEDETLKRQIEVLYLQYLEKQVDPELLRKINAKANAVEKAFNVFRAKVDGQELADSEVRKILKESTDSARRQAVWEASKRVGAEVEADLRELVALRNEAARRLGFADYHKMMLFLSEQDQVRLFNLFDELDELTREPFRQVKGEIDAKLCSLYGLSHEQLRPWHLHDPFFQEPADIFDYKLDPVYAKADILALCRQFFGGIGLPVDEVLARSDLYEKPGKSPHAFCIDIDREGDVRVLANIVPNEYWMATMLHELGHAVYSSKTIPNRMPYVLRTEAHILTTEGVAMLFEKFSKSAAWLEKMGVTVDDPAAFDAAGRRMLRHQLLIFSRWCQVMLRFERAMYEHPDQDLNKLWWDLVEKYQMVRRPDGRSAPDYASKIHICSAPVYYHNYMMGQLFASQVHHTLSREVLRCAPSQANYVGKHSVGQFLRERVFAPGRSLNWNALTKHATGEELNAKAFAADFGGN
ncbi:MAG TPA: M2 family metallopeptidase [Gemmatales bacterium]|nr:M2 family metallopeptidase [Gemmatales bacterium]HMP58689.1 M2 family metallopeptidase [Gemmatales bacterium]